MTSRCAYEIAIFAFPRGNEKDHSYCSFFFLGTFAEMYAVPVTSMQVRFSP